MVFPRVSRHNLSWQRHKSYLGLWDRGWFSLPATPLSRRRIFDRVSWQRINAELSAEEFLPSGAADGGPTIDAFRSQQLSQRPFNGCSIGLSDIGRHPFRADSASAEKGLFPIHCACALGVSRYQQNLPGSPLSE